MRRITRNQKRNKNKKIIIIISLSLLLFLCVGYAAFSTELSLKAKGNIKNMSAAEMLKKECNAESGDGLYKDIYEEGKCTYKGTDPNNYITFNGETWRIISISEDNSIKIIRKESIGNIAWDDTNINNWERPSSLNTYLNKEYIETIKDNDKVVNYVWNIGNIVEENDNLDSQIIDEYKQKSKPLLVGLITVSEYIRANSNMIECGNINLNNTNKEKCITTNWMYNIVPKEGYLWTISTNGETDVFDIIADIYNPGYINLHNYANADHVGVAPVLNLSPNIVLEGQGTEQNPYKIIN